jgi:hypothetical protein
MTGESFQHVVGQNVRRIRAEYEIRQDDLAREASRLGLKWGASRIGELEHGRLGLSVSAFLVLASSLTKLTGEPITLADLVTGENGIALSAGLELPNLRVQEVLEGVPVDFDGILGELVWRGAPVTFVVDEHGNPQLPKKASVAVQPKPDASLGESIARDLATQKAARRFGIPPADLDRSMRQLYGRSLPEERDFRAGPEASKQKRGSITRKLVQEAVAEWNRNERG